MVSEQLDEVVVVQVEAIEPSRLLGRMWHILDTNHDGVLRCVRALPFCCCSTPSLSDIHAATYAHMQSLNLTSHKTLNL